MKRFALILGLGVLLASGPAASLAQTTDESFAALRAAEAKKDAALVKKLAAQTHALAQEELKVPEPEGADMQKAWKERLAWARDVDSFTEFALYSVSLQAPPAEAIDLLQTLEKQNPKSKYLADGGYSRYFAALQQAGQTSQIVAVAQRAVANMPDCIDALLVLVDNALTKGDIAQASALGQRMVNAMNKETKPEGMAQADWDRKRSLALGHGYYAMGMAAAAGNRYYEVDRNLRAALPFIRGNNTMLGPALFQLGVANYQLGRTLLDRQRMLQAADFSDQAAKIPGPHQEGAWRNAMSIRQEASRMR
jgi:tetratricopeptide (TPR) repeat protein